MDRKLVGAIAFVLALPAAKDAGAEFPSDLGVSYDALYVGDANLAGRTVQANFLVQNLALELGYEDFGFGVLVRDTRRLDPSQRGQIPEIGTMLTGRYSPVLTDWLRLDAVARIGLTHSISDADQPLYATETDLRLSLIAFDPVGLEVGTEKLFLSGQLGSQVNWTGRTQLVGGLGLWWRQLGAYGTAFWSANGVRDVVEAEPGTDRFARLADSGISLSLTWDIEIAHDQTLQVELRQNIPLYNGGFDTAIALRWRLDLLEPAPEMAW